MAKTLDDLVAAALTSVREVTVEQLEDLAGYTVLDVREQDEFDAGHIPGAVHIPRGFIEVKADHHHPKKDERLQDRSKKIVTYCGGGLRSALAAQTMQGMGFEEVVSLKGGWAAYSDSSRPIER